MSFMKGYEYLLHGVSYLVMNKFIYHLEAVVLRDQIFPHPSCVIDSTDILL